MGFGHSLTLLVAPVGYGKSTALAEWAEATRHPVAGLTISGRDNDHLHLFRRILAAVRSVEPRFGHGLDPVGSLPTAPAGNRLGEVLADALTDLPARIALVLDDLHLLTDAESLAVVRALLAQPLPTLAVMIAARHEPEIGLASLRFRGMVWDVGVADLRFEPDEGAAFVARLRAAGHGAVSVDPEAVALVEGWPAGMRLLALGATLATTGPAAERSVPSGGQVAEAIEEVLPLPDGSDADLLRRAAVCDRFCGALLAAIAGEPHADAVADQVRRLASGDGFVVPLGIDGRGREWYRLHGLYRSVQLRQLEGREGQPGLDALRRRAVDWFVDQGLLDDAVTLALEEAGGTLAAEVVEANALGQRDRDRFAKIDEWLRLLPPMLVESRPVLGILAANREYRQGRLDAATEMLDRAEGLLDVTGSTLPESDRRLWRGAVFLLRADLAQVQSDPVAARRWEERIADLIGDHPVAEASLTHVRAFGLLAEGRRDEAVAFLVERSRAHRGRIDFTTTRPLLFLSALRLRHLELVEARDAASRLATMAREAGFLPTLAWADAWLGDAAYHLDDLDEAEAAFRRVLTLARDEQVNFLPIQEATLGTALVAQAKGQAEGARLVAERYLRTLRMAEATDLVGTAAALCARLALARGEVAEAERLLPLLPEEAVPSPAGFLVHPALTACAVMVAGDSGSAAEALRRLRRMRERAERLHERQHALSVLVIEALALDRVGRREAALGALQSALERGAAGGAVRPFLDAGPGLRPLLEALAGAGNRAAARLLVALPAQSGQEWQAEAPLLTPREQEVLQAVAQGRSNQQVALALGVSPMTVKRHLANIFRRLNVESRADAVATARNLGLVEPGSAGGAVRQ